MPTLLRRYSRPVAATAFFAGMLLFLGSMLVLGVMSGHSGPLAIEPVGPYTGNGTATYLYTLPFGSYGPHSRIQGSWEFPQTPGRFIMVRCEDADNLTRGEPISNPLRATPLARSGSVDLPARDLFFDRALTTSRFCGPEIMALQWPAGSDATANEPHADFLVDQQPFEDPGAVVLLVFAGLAVVVMAAGGAVWLRGGARAPAHAADEGESTAETLLQLTDRSIAWLERMRRYLQVGGVLGILLWYPILLGWVLSVARGAVSFGATQIALLLVAHAFLGVLTALWVREYLRLGRELESWRERLERLKQREEELMERFANL